MTLGSLSFYATDWWTIATAGVCGVACGVPGVYLVLRRMSMLGDAISHAVLPGLAAAFLLTESRAIIPMLVGALATGLLTAVLAAGVSRLGRVPEDASLGVVFSSLFAAGVLLMAFVPRDMDLDAGCVLFGQLETAVLDTRTLAGVEVPRAFIIISTLALLNLALVAACFKEIKLVAFDAGLAATLGFRPGLLHYILLGAIAATCVGSFESVGSIIVVAMMIVPGATAYLLTDRLNRMFVIAGVVALVAAFAGHAIALATNAATAGVISVVLGAEFLAAVLFSPRHGVLARIFRHIELSVRIRCEDTLASLYRATESGAPQAVSPGTLARAALRVRGLIAPGAVLSLTPKGLAAAGEIIRAHRLWETYLNERLGLPVDHLHDPAHRIEHFISPPLREEIAAEVGRATDPQGRPIPEIKSPA